MKKKLWLACGSVLLVLLVFVAGYLLSEKDRQISVTVSLDNQQMSFSQDWPLYIYAAVPGEKLPLSAYTTTLSQLPLTVKLKEDMYLLPTHTMADHDRLVVVAKISTSGDPHQAGAEDRVGRSDVIDLSRGREQQVSITIGDKSN